MSKKTLEQIVKQGNEYVVCAKANQGRLHRWIEGQWNQNQPCSSYQEREQSHGRMTSWTVAVFADLGDFDAEWAGLKRCIAVERKGTRAGKGYEERQYYISSVELSAESFHRIIRGHWGIENRLHWVKDVVFGEDDAPQRGRFAAANWSVVRNIFINVARKLGFTSMASAKRALANQWEQVFPCLQ